MTTLLAFILAPLDSAFSFYTTLFFILILSGVGLPIPEEITLLLGGYLAYLEIIHFWPTVYILIAGILVADVLGYVLGKFAGEWVSRKLVRFRVAALLLERAKWYFDRHGEKMILFSRPLLGVRVAVPIMAGHFRMNFFKFFLYDAVGAIPWTFLLVSVSYYLGSGLDLITDIREIKHIIFILVGIGIVLYAIRLMKKQETRV